MLLDSNNIVKKKSWESPYWLLCALDISMQQLKDYHLKPKSSQGPLKKWMEHSQELHLSRGGSYYTQGLDGGLFLDHELL